MISFTKQNPVHRHKRRGRSWRKKLLPTHKERPTSRQLAADACDSVRSRKAYKRVTMEVGIYMKAYKAVTTDLGDYTPLASLRLSLVWHNGVQ